MLHVNGQGVGGARVEIFQRGIELDKSKPAAQDGGVQYFPIVEDGNFENKGELLLVHRHEGLDLDPAWGAETLAAVARLWSRPANVITEREGKKVRLRHDGTELRTIEM